MNKIHRLLLAGTLLSTVVSLPEVQAGISNEALSEGSGDRERDREGSRRRHSRDCRADAARQRARGVRGRGSRLFSRRDRAL